MSQTSAEYLILALSFSTFLFALPRVIRYLRDPDSRVTVVGLLVLCVGSIIGEAGLTSKPLIWKLSYTGIFIVSLVVAGLQRFTGPRRALSSTSILLVFILWAWLFAVNIALNRHIMGASSIVLRLAPGLVWIALLLVWNSIPLDRAMLASVATLALTIPGIMVQFSSDSWRPCDVTKCGIFDGMLRGPYSSENYMGLQISFLTVLHISTFGFRRSVYLLPLSVAWLLATASRTALYALIAALAVAFLLHCGSKVVKTTRRFAESMNRALATAVPLCFIIIAAQLTSTDDRHAFSGRGLAWQRGRELLREHQLVGLGADAWNINQGIGLLPPQLGAHSVYLYLAFSGGVVAILLFGLLMRSILISSLEVGGQAVSSVSLVFAFLTLGLLEIVWNPMTIDGFTWIALALLVSPDGAGGGVVLSAKRQRIHPLAARPVRGGAA